MGVNMVLRESFKRTFKKFNMGCTAEQQFYISICSIEEKHRQYSTFSSNFNSCFYSKILRDTCNNTPKKTSSIHLSSATQSSQGSFKLSV